MAKFHFASWDRLTLASRIKIVFRRAMMAIAASSIILAARLHAQVPTLLWRTNVNATLFAVDSQTNVYANANGTVITLNSQGMPFKTNSYCPVPSIAPEFAVRDFSGNFYFAGNFDGTNDFGGKIVVGGWTNNTPHNKWEPGYPTGFLAKYAPNGALIGATRIDGLIAGSNVVSDLVLNPDDSVTVGIYVGINFAQIVQVSSTSSNLWQSASLNPQFDCGPVKLTGLHGTNGGFQIYELGQGIIAQGHYTSSGTKAFDSSKGVTFTPDDNLPNGKPVVTPADELYMAGRGQFGQLPSLLQKTVIGGSVVWTQAVANVETWLLNGDNKGNLYVSGTDGSFYEYNSAGTQIWTNNYGSPGVFGLSDLIGNRLVQFADNTIALLSADPGAVTPHVHLSGQAGDGLTSAGFQFSLSADAGSTYQVIYTTNFTSWQSMGYVSSSNSDIQVVDPDATNRLQKFYQLAP